jgi:hypothetical protein
LRDAEGHVTDFDRLIPELRDWNNGRGIDVQDWIGAVGDFQKAVGYSAIFWPEFAEIDGFVVRAGVTREQVQGWLRSCGGKRPGFEALINHFHLVDLQYTGCPDASPERVAYLGRVLKEIYECKLRRDFPGRTFRVELYQPADNPQNLNGYELTFFQVEEAGG